MKTAVRILIATIIPFVSGDVCEDLNARAEALYNSTECQLVKAITLDNVLAGSQVPKKEAPASCTTRCIHNVSKVVNGVIDQGCSITGAGIAPFLYPIHDNDQDFLAMSEFLCEHSNCAEEIRMALTSYDCNLIESGKITAQCFERAPCDCLEKFLQLFGNASPDFQEDYFKFGPQEDIEIMSHLKQAYENGTCAEEGYFPSGAPPGFGIAAVIAAAAAMFVGHLFV